MGGFMVRGIGGWRGCAALAAVIFAAAGAVTAPTPASAGAEEPGSLFVVTSGDESMQDAIAEQAAVDPEYRERAQALVVGWKKDLAAGRPLDLGTLTKGLTTQESLAALTGLEQEISSPPPASASSQAVVVPMSSGENPNTYPVRGSAGSGRTSWQMQLIMAGRYCGPSSCGPDTDRITCRLTVNPGARTSRYDSNCTYFPNAGNLSDPHYELWAINRGAVVGNTDTTRLFSGSGGSGSYYLSSSRALNGTVLTNAAKLWVRVPQGTYSGDGAKTADAACNTSNNVCKY